MKEIKLTQGKVAIVDDEDFDWLNNWKWYAFKSRNVWYAGRGGAPKRIQMHQALCPWELLVDHRDGDGLNNQRCNLRPCSRAQNKQNAKKYKIGTSQFKGVSWFKRLSKWRADIRVEKKLIHLGRFTEEHLAARAYDEAAKKYFGEFARPNFT